MLAWKRSLVTLRPDTPTTAARERFLCLHERIGGWPTGAEAGDYLATFRALDPEDAAELLPLLVDLKNALRLLLKEHDA